MDFVDDVKKNVSLPFRIGARVYAIFDILSRLSQYSNEGYEYPILLNTSNETLSHFDQMVIECHYGYLNIENRLKRVGFKVTHTMTSTGGWTKNTCRNLVYAFRR